MRYRKLCCLVITLSMLCGLCACGKKGASNTLAPKESREIPAATYHSAAEAFAGGSGTEADPYQIATAEQLALFAQVNEEYSADYNNACFVQTADIALNDTSDFSNWEASPPEYQWKPVQFYFKGCFDGGGFSISGMYIRTACLMSQKDEARRGYLRAGLFADVSGVVIENVNLVQAYIQDDRPYGDSIGIGCLAGSVHECQIRNCTVDGVIRAENNISGIGGIASTAGDSVIEGCNFIGTIDGRKCSEAGGIVGTAIGAETLLKNCTAEGVIRLQNENSSAGIGGIAASAYSCRAENCVNRMDVSGDAYGLGGVFGSISITMISDLENWEWSYRNGSFEAVDCVNHGAVTGGEKSDGVGGIVGRIHNSDSRADEMKLTSCVNYGSVTGNTSVGGVIGDLYSGYTLYTIQSCENQGSVSGETAVGGVIGGMSSCVDGSKILSCVNSGTVSAPSPVGGIVGRYFGVSLILPDGKRGQTLFDSCENSGTVDSLGGISGTGGILGELHMDGDNESVLIKDCRNTGTIRSESSARMGGILGTTSALLEKGTWTINGCTNSGTISFGSGTRDFAVGAGPEQEFEASMHVDPSAMSEAEYQQSVEDRTWMVAGGSCVGGIVGRMSRGTVENCVSGGEILLDAESGCYTGAISGQLYQLEDAAPALIRSCRYRADWPIITMPAPTELAPDALKNVTPVSRNELERLY